MKKSYILKTLFFAFILVFNNCSSSDSSDDSGGGDGGGDGGGNGITSLTVQVSSSTDCGIYEGDAVSFSVTGDSDQDLTSASTISVNGNAISGNTYTTSTFGSLQVTAAYDNVTSSALQVNVSEDVVRFVKNVLIEDYTGTWCGYCPRVSEAINLTAAETDQIAVIAVHNDAEFNCPEVAQLEAAFSISGYPTAKIDRKSDWTFPEPSNIDQVVDKTLCDNSEAGLSVTPTLNGNTMSIDVKVKFTEGFSYNNTKLVVMVLEDGLIADQENYTSYFGGVSVIPNFVHNHVLRSSLTNVSGDLIPTTEISNSVYSRSFSVDVPANIANTANMSIVAFISNEDFIGGTDTINARVGHFGESQTFQEN